MRKRAWGVVLLELFILASTSGRTPPGSQALIEKSILKDWLPGQDSNL